VDVYDPNANANEAKRLFQLGLVPSLELNSYDAIILAVGHTCFVEMGAQSIRALGKATSVLFDTKAVLGTDYVDGRL